MTSKSHPFWTTEEAAENIARATELARKAMAFFVEKHSDENGFSYDPYGLAPTIGELLEAIKNDPSAWQEASTELWQKQARLWTETVNKALDKDKDPGNPISLADQLSVAPWEGNFIFEYVEDNYAMTSEWMRRSITKLDKSLPELQRKKLEFFTERLVEALAPRNFFFLNPEALRVTVEENGENLVRGMSRLIADLERGQGDIWISQTDMDAFEVGRNIATTKGSVVFKNRLIELILYAPTTETVHETPILIAPPWINKYYILDLNEQKSMIRWLVSQGFTVFVISWKNPVASKRWRDFEDYITEGYYEAIDAVLKETGAQQLNTVGYCIGGTMQATALAHMAQTKDERIKSATFFAAQADFEKSGDLRIFADDAAIKAIEEQSERTGGIINAQQMASAFNMLRSNELIWNYVIRNYYLGKEPRAFDLLYWNADSTRMPARCHQSYLRHYYRENALARGTLTLLGERLDLKAIKQPVYSVATKEDHIAPAESVFRSVKLFGGPERFVLGGSGHIAGIVNPPAPDKGRYQHWISDEEANELPDTLDEWVSDSTEIAGSWWPDWAEWLRGYSGKMIPQRQPGTTLGIIEPAPGSYVKVRSDLPYDMSDQSPSPDSDLPPKKDPEE